MFFFCSEMATQLGGGEDEQQWSSYDGRGAGLLSEVRTGCGGGR